LVTIRDRLLKQAVGIEEAIRPLQEQLTRVRGQLDFIERALQIGAGIEQPTKPANELQAVKPNIADRVLELLKEAAQPLHISEIRNRYIAKGFTVPGRGNESNLLVYIVRDPRFIRVSKGTYAVAEGGVVPVPNVKPKAKKRRRKKAKE